MKLLLLSLLPLWIAADPFGQGLVSPQSACRIRCENGGMCAFSFTDPSVHTCICLIGVYSGERCQIKVGEDPLEKVKMEREQQAALTQSRIEEERREAEMRANDQRRREYEQKIREMEEQRRAQEHERKRHEEAYRQREEERRRVDKQNKAEHARREHEHRLQEERKRQHEQSLREQNRIEQQHPVYPGNGQPPSQTIEEQRAREEERRQEDLRKLVERKRQEEERRRIDEEQRRKEEARNLNNYDPEELTDEDMEPDHSEMEQINWREREKNGEDSQIQSPPTSQLDHSSITNILEQAAFATAEKHGIELGEEIETAPYEDPIDKEDEDKSHEDNVHVEGVKNILENAAEKAAEEHDIDLNAAHMSDEDEEKINEDDDYWDHHPKKEEPEYEAPKEVDPEDDDHLNENTLELKKDEASKEDDLSETNKIKEYDLEDNGSWMVEKRADSQKDDSSVSSFLSLIGIIVTSMLFFI